MTEEEQRDRELLLLKLRRYEKALNDIIHPLQYLEEEAAKAGGRINGMAAMIMNDVSFYQDIARKALN